MPIPALLDSDSSPHTERSGDDHRFVDQDPTNRVTVQLPGLARTKGCTDSACCGGRHPIGEGCVEPADARAGILGLPRI